MKVALYARVSKALEQNPENQLIELRRWAAAAAHEVEGEYVDEISSRDTRPQKEAVLRKLRLGTIDAVAFYKLDRWGRNISELVYELQEFRGQKGLISIKEGIDLSTAGGRMFANILAVFAEFERDMTQERTLLGQARALAQGKIIGRHPVGCGCGAPGHSGDIMPRRDESNRFIGWDYPDGAYKPAGWSKVKGAAIDKQKGGGPLE